MFISVHAQGWIRPAGSPLGSSPSNTADTSRNSTSLAKAMHSPADRDRYTYHIELEISPFLTVIQFYGNIAEKRIGKSQQEISTRPTFKNIRTNLKGTK